MKSKYLIEGCLSFSWFLTFPLHQNKKTEALTKPLLLSMEVEITSDAGTKRPAATGDSNPRPKKKPNSDSAPTQPEDEPTSPPGDDLERLKITIRTLIIESAQTQQDLQNAEEEVIRLRQENETLRFITADHHMEAIPSTATSSENEKNGQEEEGGNGEGGETIEVRRHCPAPACPEHS